MGCVSRIDTEDTVGTCSVICYFFFISWAHRAPIDPACRQIFFFDDSSRSAFWLSKVMFKRGTYRRDHVASLPRNLRWGFSLNVDDYPPGEVPLEDYNSSRIIRKNLHRGWPRPATVMYFSCLIESPNGQPLQEHFSLFSCCLTSSLEFFLSTLTNEKLPYLFSRMFA